MGSIPLPALDLKPVQQPDALGSVEKMMALKSMMGQQQLQQGQIQLQQQKVKDQQLVQQDLQANPHHTFADAADALHGKITPEAEIALRDSDAKIVQQHAAATQDQLNNGKAIHERLSEIYNNAMNLPDDQLAAQTPQIAQQVNSIPGSQFKIDPSQPLTKDKLKEYGVPLALNEAYLKQEAAKKEQAATTAKEQAQTGEATQKTEESKAATEKTQLEVGAMKQFGGMTPAFQEAKYIALQQKKNSGQALSADDQAFTKAYEKNKTLVPTANFNLQNAVPGQGGGQPSAIAQAVANGQMKWGDVISPRTPQTVKEALLKEVKAINPNFNSGDFTIEQSVKKEFTSGDAAKNLTAFNTAIEHAKQLQTAADALQNGDIPALNRVGNALGYQFGFDKKTNFNVIKNALTGEISKVFKGGQATDAEIKAVQEPFNAANSPAQLKGAIDNAVALMNSKRDALKQQYESGLKAKPNFGNEGGTGKQYKFPDGTIRNVSPDKEQKAQSVGAKPI